MHKICELYNVYNRFEKIILGIAMCLLIILGFMQVVFRFALHMSLSWVEELLTFVMIWAAYLGASAATNERKHIMVNMFVDLLPQSLRKGFTIFSQLLWITCTIAMTYFGLHITLNYISRGATTLGGTFPFWVASIIIPLSMALITVRVIILMRNTLKGERDTISQEELIREEMDK